MRKRLWYETEAVDWEREALPLGNGRLGVMFYGGVMEERLQFNEETLYSGRPEGVDETAYLYLEQIRTCLKEKKYGEAQKIMDSQYLSHASFGDKSNFGEYQNFGEVRILFFHEGEIEDYIRELDLEHALGHVRYKIGGKQFEREYFVSHPENAFFGRFASEEKGSLNMEISLAQGQENARKRREGNCLILEGKTEYIGYEARLQCNVSGGNICFFNDRIQIRDADEAVLVLTAATEYDQDSDDYRGKDYVEYNCRVLGKTANYSYEECRNRHEKDYRSLFDKMDVYVEEEIEDIPTDRLLKEYGNGKKNIWAELLPFYYSRYLLISSSREDTLPANLQGIWNNSNQPEWGFFVITSILI